MPDAKPLRSAVNALDHFGSEIARSVGVPPVNYWTVWNAALGNEEARNRIRTEGPRLVRFGVKLAGSYAIGRSPGVARFLATNAGVTALRPVPSNDPGVLDR